MAKMTSSTEKLDHMLRVGRKPSDKSGLGYIDDKDASSSSKTSVVMDMNIMMSPPPQHPRKKIDLGECSRSAQVFEAPKVKLKLTPKELLKRSSVKLKTIKGRVQSCKLNRGSNQVLVNNKEGEILSNNQDNHNDKGMRQCMHMGKV